MDQERVIYVRTECITPGRAAPRRAGRGYKMKSAFFRRDSSALLVYVYVYSSSAERRLENIFAWTDVRELGKSVLYRE